MESASELSLKRKVECKKLKKETRRTRKAEQLSKLKVRNEKCQDWASVVENPRLGNKADESVAKPFLRQGKVEQREMVEKWLRSSDGRENIFPVVDAQFNEEDTLYGVSSLEDDGDEYQDYFSVSASGPFSSALSQTPEMTMLDTDLFDNFYNFLAMKGPVNVLDIELDNHTGLLSKASQARIRSLGGLSNYLCFDPRFKISHDIVSIVKAEKNKWVDVPDHSTSSHDLSTTSTYILQDITTRQASTPASLNREHSNVSINESILNSSHSDFCKTSRKQSHYYQHQEEKSAEYKQDLLTMFMELKDDLNFLKLNSATKDSLRCCHEMIRQNMLLVDELKRDTRKLNADNIQLTEASEEKWKTSYDVLLREHNDLQASNEAQTVALNKQLESEMTKSLNTEIRLVDMGKMATLYKIELKIIEADSYVKMLDSGISQITPVLSLPNAVHEKREELYSYITSCKNLKHQVEETAQRLKNNLKSGLNIDVSDIEINLPAVPVPPHSQASPNSVSSAVSNSGSYAPSNNNGIHVSSYNGFQVPSNNGSQVPSNIGSHVVSDTEFLYDSDTEYLHFSDNESVTTSNSEHLAPYNRGNLAHSSSEQLASSNREHLTPPNREHMTPSRSKHLTPSTPSSSEYLAPAISPSHVTEPQIFPAHSSVTLNKDTSSQKAKSDIPEIHPHVYPNFQAQLTGHSGISELNDENLQHYSRSFTAQKHLNHHQLPQVMHEVYPLYSRPEHAQAAVPDINPKLPWWTVWNPQISANPNQ